MDVVLVIEDGRMLQTSLVALYIFNRIKLLANPTCLIHTWHETSLAPDPLVSGLAQLKLATARLA